MIQLPALTQRQLQKQTLVQRIELVRMLHLHPATIDLVLDSMTKNYERAEEVLSSQKDHVVEGSVRGLFSEFYSGKGSKKDGFIAIPPLKELTAIVGVEEVGLEADIIYVQSLQKSDKPEIFFSQNILPTKPEMKLEQIPLKYKMTRSLYAALFKFKEWVNEKARSGYDIFASRQREYINSLNPIEKNIYSMDMLGKDLGVHESTIWRIFNWRYIVVENPERSTRTTLPSKDLFCTRQGLVRLRNLGLLNKYFIKEAKSKKGAFDYQISKKIGCPCRTIAKYRKQGDIPLAHIRTDSYKKNSNKVYTVPLGNYR